MPTFNYSGYHLPSDEMRVAHPRLARFGCLGGLIAFVLVCVLIYLGVWYPDFWFGIAVIGVPVLAILWAILFATAFIARI